MSVSSFKSSEIKRDGNFLTYRPILEKIVEKQGMFHFVIVKWLRRCVLGFSLDL